MPFREDILKPISEEKPGGADLRYDPAYDKIKEARREEEDIDQGAWKRERKVADWPLTIRLSEEFLATKSKDLQVAVWLAEAATKQRGIAGFLDGLLLVHELIAQFWDHLYPEIEDGDVEFRSTPLEWLINQSLRLVREVPLTKDGYGLFKYKESREVGKADSVTNDAARKARDAKIAEGRLPAEVFDESFTSTPKTYYVALDGNFAKVIEATKTLSALCDEKFGQDGPTFSRLMGALEEVKQTTKMLLDRKRELEPDPIEEKPEEETPAEGEATEGAEGAGNAAEGTGVRLASFEGAEIGPRKAIIESVLQAAEKLRQMDPYNPGSYLLTRGLRFGELRASAARGEVKLLEAPPTEVRRQLRIYALESKWKEMLALCEASMALPASRAWMDLQRLSVEALNGLGDQYAPVAQAIRSEVRALVHDVPELKTAILMDDTPACNPQTLAWIEELQDDPAGSGNPPAEGMVIGNGQAGAPAWRSKPTDPFKVAVEALRRGDKAKALEIMRNDIESQPSARGKFLRQLQVAELCIQAGAKEVAQPFFDDVKTAINDFKLVYWEDRSLIVQALADLYLYHDATIDDKKDRAQTFQRVCRLDPVRALTLKS